MKTQTLIAIVLALFAAAMLANGQEVPTNTVATATNAVASTGMVSDTLKPLTDLLGGKGTWITTIISWLAAISLALAPFTVWIQHKLADMTNAAAESAERDDDDYLKWLFSKPWYKFGTFLLRFANIQFPTLSDLERALKLQDEAVREAVNPTLFDNDKTKKI